MTDAILVTGGFGFVGCNFILALRNRYPNAKIINLDSMTYAAEPDSLSQMKNDKLYVYEQGDIADSETLSSLFQNHDIRGVVHFAAESHADNSIGNPEVFIKTNVLGTYHLLNAAYRYWMDAANSPKEAYKDCRFVNVSTNEVFGSLGEYGLFNENSPFAPNSPFSATKAGADMLVRSYFYTYGLNVVTSNCSNNFGPWQHDEKLIPTIIRKALAGEPVPIYGDGRYIRSWLYVKDHCEALLAIFEKGKSGDTYIVGGQHEKDNISVARQICTLLDTMYPISENMAAQERSPNARTYGDLIQFVADRPGHDRRYAVDLTKVEKELAWQPVVDFETALRKTIIWYVKKYTGVKLNF